MKTKAGCDPEGALKEIEAQAQARSTCPVCKGKKVLRGRTMRHAATNRISTEPPDTLTQLVIECPECEDGTVPAGPQGDLAQWREELKPLLDGATITHNRGLPVLGLRTLLKHLAAMPQAQPDARFESIAVQHNREVRIRTALLAYRDSDDGDLDALDVAVRAIEHELLPPQAQPDAELLKALKRLDEEIEEISGNADACVFCGDASGDSHSKECPITQARAAIAQAEEGAPA